MSELPLYLNFVMALAFVLGLIGVAAWLARRFGLAGRLAHRAGPSHRLAVVEVMPLDTRRKLVAGLHMLTTKREELPRRKHGNVPL